MGVQVPLRAPDKYWKINELPWIIPRRLIPHLLCDSAAGACFGACWIFQFARPQFGLQRTECVEVKGGNSVQPGASFCAPPPSCRLFAVLLAILIVVNPPDSASRRTLKNAALFRVLLFWFAQFSFSRSACHGGLYQLEFAETGTMIGRQAAVGCSDGRGPEGLGCASTPS